MCDSVGPHAKLQLSTALNLAGSAWGGGVKSLQRFEPPRPPCPWDNAAPSIVFDLGHGWGVEIPQLSVTEPHSFAGRKAVLGAFASLLIAGSPPDLV